MDVIKQGWVDKTFEAILKVERYLGIKREATEEYAKLANWIYYNQSNPYGYMPDGWGGAKESAQTFASFLGLLLHEMVDDGVLLFVETEIHGSFMIFGVDQDDTSRIKEIYDKRFSESSHRPYHVHMDVQRFIEHYEGFELYSSQRDERHAARMEAISAEAEKGGQ